MLLIAATAWACSDRREGRDQGGAGAEARRQQESAGAGAAPGERKGATPAQTGGQSGGPGAIGSAGETAAPGGPSGAGDPGRTEAASSQAAPLVGRVQSIEQGRIVVELAQDETPAEVSLSPETQFARGGEEIERSSVSPGADVRVAWEVQGGQRTATRVELLDAPPER
jgi:hypothetical protein